MSKGIQENKWSVFQLKSSDQDHLLSPPKRMSPVWQRETKYSTELLQDGEETQIYCFLNSENEFGIIPCLSCIFSLSPGKGSFTSP